MQHVGRLYVRHVNDTYGRTGTLWEGRHKAGLVDADDYLLVCYSYIELNPVRAGMVVSAEQYPWSSNAWHAWGHEGGLIMDHHLYQGLGEQSDVRQSACRQLFSGFLPDESLSEMNEAIGGSYPVGNNRFRERIMRQLGRSIGQAKRGRPPVRRDWSGWFNHSDPFGPFSGLPPSRSRAGPWCSSCRCGRS